MPVVAHSVLVLGVRVFVADLGVLLELANVDPRVGVFLGIQGGICNAIRACVPVSNPSGSVHRIVLLAAASRFGREDVSKTIFSDMIVKEQLLATTLLQQHTLVADSSALSDQHSTSATQVA